MLTINYFASLRETLGDAREQLSLPPGTATVADLIDHLVGQRDERWAILKNSEQVLVAVDQTIVSRSHPLSGTEELAFFPPMTGG